MTNAQYRSFSGTYRVTVEFSLKYCDYSIKRKSSSNVGYGTNRNSVKGSQVVVTITRKQNFFKKKIAKYSLLSLLYQHTRQISNQNSFWMNIIQILQLKIQEKESYQILSCDQECSFIRNKNTKSQLLTHYVKQRERQQIFSISRTIF